MTAKTFKHKSQIDKQKVYIKTNINSFLPSLGCSTVLSEYGTHLVLPDSVQSQLLMPEERNQQKENKNLFFFFFSFFKIFRCSEHFYHKWTPEHFNLVLIGNHPFSRSIYGSESLTVCWASCSDSALLSVCPGCVFSCLSVVSSIHLMRAE